MVIIGDGDDNESPKLGGGGSLLEVASGEMLDAPLGVQ